MAMELVFTQNSPLDTTLVDEAKGVVVYEIATEEKFFSKTTVIRKPFISQQGMFVPGTFTEVARIQWKKLSSDKIMFGGQKMKREEFMPNAGIFTHGFLITVNGMEYRWSTRKGLPRLVTNDSDKTLIAKLHEENKVFLEVTPAGFAMLDTIAVSLVYVETKRREEEDSTGDKSKEGGHGGEGGGGEEGKKGGKGGERGKGGKAVKGHKAVKGRKGGKEGKEVEVEVELGVVLEVGLELGVEGGDGEEDKSEEHGNEGGDGEEDVSEDGDGEEDVGEDVDGEEDVSEDVDGEENVSEDGDGEEDVNEDGNGEEDGGEDDYCGEVDGWDPSWI